MKKVLKLILVLAVVSALSLSVFAASPAQGGVTPTPSEPTLIPTPSDSTRPVVTPGDFVISATTDASDDIEVIIIVPGDPDRNAVNEKAAAAAAKAAGAKVVGTAGSYDIIVRRKSTGEILHSGPTVNVMLGGVAPYIGKFANIWETSEAGATRLLTSFRVTSDTVAVSHHEYSTFTVVITEEPMQSATSPRTSQNAVSYVLIAVAVLAFVGVLYANKQRKAA
jgi:hypothetical protein